MDGLDGDGHEVAEGVGPEQEGLVHLDAALQSGPAHHRPHTRHRVGVVDLKLGRLVVYNKNKNTSNRVLWIRIRLDLDQELLDLAKSRDNNHNFTSFLL